MKNLEEANLSHLREKFKNYDIATISASRDSYNRNEKRDMNKSLRDDLMNSPYEVITIQGGYPETVDNSDETKDVKERSFFVVNYSNYDEAKTKAFEDFMFGLCDKYNQDSIFIKTNNIPAGLYDRDRNVVDFGDGPMNNMTKLNSDPKQPYYSRINGSKFSFQKESTEGKSMFRQLVERVLAENGYDLKEWDEDDYDDEYYGNPDDYTTDSEEVEWTVDLPMNDQIRQAIIQANIVGEEDLKDDAGNWLPTSEFDVIVEYDVDGYPDDEYITVNKIYLEDYDMTKHQTYKGTDITQFLPKEFLEKVANELEESGKIELHSHDYEGQVRDDYYSMIAPGGKL